MSLSGISSSEIADPPKRDRPFISSRTGVIGDARWLQTACLFSVHRRKSS
jgi:hypothetical protein